uniref:Glycosyl transferase family 11 n=1 Tax=Caenorhabditis tropicalis TaxID=1561998 RepID=A0A1I7UDW6_9PELO
MHPTVPIIIPVVAVSIITIFENRYFLLFAEHTWWRHARYPFLATNYILGILYYLPTVLSVPDQPTAREIIFKEFPEFRALDTPSNPVYVLVLDNPWVSVRQIAMEATVVIECLVIVMMLKMKMKNVVSLPLLVILIPSAISVFSGILGISTQSVNNLVYITFSCHGLTSTIVMLTIQNPYREFCLGMVGKNRMPRKATVSGVSTKSITNVTTF